MLTEPPEGKRVETEPEPHDPAAALDPVGGRVIGGVAYELAGRLGVDPLWPRLVFILLALAGGLGLVLYLGLWLLMIVGQRPGWSALRIVGGVVLTIGALVLFGNGDTDLVGGPVAWAAVLAGVALALWQPRVVPDGPQAIEAIDAPLPTAGSPARWTRPRRPQREPSVLGRAVLGIALLTLAAGALIDQLNGGRLHPEQWLGVAAAVCGAGALLGAWRGRALWLAIPGLLFAGAGYVAGHAAWAGVDAWDWGERYLWIGPEASPSRIDERTIMGTTHLDIAGVPSGDGTTADLRVGVGAIDISIDDDVSVEIRARIGDGDLTGDGIVPLDDGRATFTIGPERPPDVVVNATIGQGDINVQRYDMGDQGAIVPTPAELAPPWVPDDAGLGAAVDIGERLTMASDGTVLLPDRAGAIGPDGELWVATAAPPRDDGVTEVMTEYGELYLILPNQMIITPSGMLVDVPARRLALLGPPAPDPGSGATTVPVGEG